MPGVLLRRCGSVTGIGESSHFPRRLQQKGAAPCGDDAFANLQA